MNLKVGFGCYNVTPPLGVEMAGYAQREGVAEGLHDELTARAIVFESEGQSAALVAADLCMLPVEVCGQATAGVQERTGIPTTSVIVAAVHTHSGPNVSKEGAYRTLLPDLLASAAELAWRRREPARLFYGSGQVNGLCVNRRLPDGPVDEELAFLAAEDTGGQLLGLLFSYPLHGVIMGSNNLEISADYMGVARRVIEENVPGATAVFVASPSGEMNPLTPSVKALLEEHGNDWYAADPLTGIYDRTTGTFEEVEQFGRTIGEAVLGALDRKEAVASGELRAKAWSVDIGQESELPVTLGGIHVGDVAILALPGEHFVDTGFRLKEMATAAGRRPILLTHAGQLSYVPPPEAFAEGGYEVMLARRRGIAEDAQQRILESVRREFFAM